MGRTLSAGVVGYLSPPTARREISLSTFFFWPLSDLSENLQTCAYIEFRQILQILGHSALLGTVQTFMTPSHVALWYSEF